MRREVHLPRPDRVGYTSAMLTSELIPAAQKDSRRLLVALHGLGDSMDGYRWLPEAMNLPWLNYLLVNAPDDYFGGYSWFDFPGDATPGVLRSTRLLVELLDAQRQQDFPTEETVLFGFSQGCVMAMEAGLRYPHRFAGIVGVSGWVPDPARLLREASPLARDQRLLLTHGLFDPLLPIAPVREQVRQLRAAGLQVEWHEFAKEHTIAGEAELAVIHRFVVAAYAA
ncbi:MAG: serine esterase [Limisphaerales bacterium]|nr:MAG: serine esterase [Limisphaerales bacterium]KAG0510169.1 MAG: serine esterase [Limisphaerales bacterium]TXT51948.1 MAG: serine esterase [Limisphaerales bacterium]